MIKKKQLKTKPLGITVVNKERDGVEEGEELEPEEKVDNSSVRGILKILREEGPPKNLSTRKKRKVKEY